MRQQYFRNIIGSIGLGLTSLLNTGCPPVIDPSGLPSDDLSEGRQIVVYEEDIQQDPQQKLSFNVGPAPFLGAEPSGAIVTSLFDSDGKRPPFDLILRSKENADGTRDFYIDFLDNDAPFLDGARYSVRIESKATHSFPAVPINVIVTYQKGLSPDNLTERVEELESIIGPPMPPITQPPLEKSTPLEELLDGNRTYVQFVDEQNNPIPELDPITGETYKIRLNMPAELEQRLGGESFRPSFDLIELGNNPCISLTHSAVERISEGIYQVTGSIIKEAGCPSPFEFAEGRYGINIGDGEVFYTDASEFMRN